MEAKKTYKFKPEYAVPPGETLKEVMDSMGMTQKEFAIRTELTVQTLNRIFKGEQPITYETSDRLEMVTGTPARFWNNLEGLYREQLAKIEGLKQLEADLEWLKTLPTRELAERNYIELFSDKKELLRETLSFYGVSSANAWRELWESPTVAARRSMCFESEPGPASAWLRMGEIEANKIVCSPYNKERFNKALKVIRSLTREEPAVFEPEMKRLCAESGVAVALVREVKKVPWNGATKWLTPNKAMILLCLRGKGEDKFWFSFFHEAGHVLHDPKKSLFINDGQELDPRERKANRFAAQTLIPEKHNEEICHIRSGADIDRMAEKLDVAPGIVAGRYQHLTKKWSHFKGQIKMLKWVQH